MARKAILMVFFPASAAKTGEANVDTHAMSTIAPKNAADRNVNHNANGTRVTGDIPVNTLDM
jgi:hypothetical protein